MRCAPVAIRFRRDPARLVDASLASARVTHAEPRAVWAAVAVNQAIAHLLDGSGIDGIAEAASRGVPEPDVARAVREAAGRSRDELRAGGFIVETLSAAFWAVCATPSAEEAIVAAVNLGEDADTTGAVAGALAGARWGAAALPVRWLDRLERRAELEDQARRLVTLSRART